MQNNKLPGLFLNLLILMTVIGLTLTGWLAGHILRFSMRELWHPPIEEIDPKIKTGDIFELEGRRIVASADSSSVRIYVDEELLVQSLEFNLCQGNTYYTSRPAKCHSADGRLERVDGLQQKMRIIPYGEWERENDLPFNTP